MTEQATQRRPRVIVGVDGSPAAYEAVRFAVREAALRGADLVAVMSVELPDYCPVTVVRPEPRAEVKAAPAQPARRSLEESRR